MATVSRAVLSKWLSETTGDQIGTTMEKQCVIFCPHSPTPSSPFAQHSSCVAARLFLSSRMCRCANGHVYCQVLEALHPGSLNLAKVNAAADAEHANLANYKLLAAGLEKAGFEHTIDTGNLAKGQPAATLDVVHKLYAFSGAEPPAPAKKKGLAPRDANALDAGNGGGGGGKRKAAAAPAPPAIAAKRAKEEVAAAVTASEATTNNGGGGGAAEAAETPVEAVLRQQLEAARAEAQRFKAEAGFVAEERDFYMRKLECIEDACATCDAEASGALAQTVLKVLGANENEIERLAAAIL